MTNSFFQARNIFDFSLDDYSDADYGIQIPQAVTLNVARQTSTFMEDFQSEEEYIRRRLSDLQVSLETVDTNIFRMKNRGGFTRSKDSNGKHSVRKMMILFSTCLEKVCNSLQVQQYSYLLEKRLFQLTLKDLEEKNLLLFSQSFQKALKSVPDYYDKSNMKVVRDIQVKLTNLGHDINKF